MHAAEEVFGKEHVAARIHCRQQQWKRRDVRTSETSEVMEQATRGLVNMGFGASAVKKTLLALMNQRNAGAPPLPELLREAIAALT